MALVSRRFSKIVYFLAFLSIFVAAVSPDNALAQTLTAKGYPVSSVGSTTQIGAIDSNGFIRFFIPFTPAASGTYAVDNGGTVGFKNPDKGAPGPGGNLTMHLAFGPIQGPVGASELRFEFTDLDLLGSTSVSTQFHETVRFFGSNGSTGLIDSIDDSTDDYTVSVAPQNKKLIDIKSAVMLSDLVDSHFYFITLKFQSLNTAGKGTNDIELLRPTLTYTKRTILNVSGAARLLGSTHQIPGVSISGNKGLGSITTTASGTFAFNDIANGSYTLTASKIGYQVVSDPNPVIVNGQSVQDADFVLSCATGYQLTDNDCVLVPVPIPIPIPIPTPERIVINASDGTFKDYVLVQWTQTTTATSYELYRSNLSGERGEKIADVPAKQDYQDTSAIPDQRYYYTVIGNDSIRSNQDEGWRPAAKNQCQEGEECYFEKLEPFACASANGFLGQVNIATVINRFSTDLEILVEYRDLFGNTKGSVKSTIVPLQKMDFIVNDLGLAPDSYGTVCVTVETEERGAWSGGVTLYKANNRDGDISFGSDFDFVLYYPFANPRVGSYTLPLNTFHLGVPASATIANWIRITDAEKADGEPLRGTLYFFDDAGKQLSASYVTIPNGGRFDFSGHDGLAGINNPDAVGMARFEAADKSDGTVSRYYISLGRYFYDCLGASCENFFTAFVIPSRPATNVATSGGVSTVDGELSIVEFNNTRGESSAALINTFIANGAAAGSAQVSVPARGTRHTIVNQAGAQGFFAANTVGSATVRATEGMVSSTSIFYKLDDNGVLEYAYAAPLVGSPGAVQVSEFNSFINNTNTIELFNSSVNELAVQVNAIDATNTNVLSREITLKPNQTSRFPLDVPADTYGTITVQADEAGIVFRNYVSAKGEYTLSFGGR